MINSGVWVLPAVLSAVFAAATAILAKIGIENVDSNVASAVRTVVILIFAWGIVIAQGHAGDIAGLTRRSWLFLVLSGVATGLSWLCYFYAIKIGPVTRVATVDKMSLALTILLSVIVLHEQSKPQVFIGAACMIAGAIITTLK